MAGRENAEARIYDNVEGVNEGKRHGIVSGCEWRSQA
jgi:hypothetical protein